MTRICHAHCPDEGGAWFLVLLAVAAVTVAWALAPLLNGILAAIFWTLLAALAGSVVVLVRVLRRPGVYRVAAPAQQRRAMAASAPAPALARQPQAAITARPVHSITDLPAAHRGARAHQGERN